MSIKRFLTTGLVVGAAILILGSILLPYWQIKIKAPQYPKGLVLQVYVNHLKGDVSEIDMLNHYIGMKSLNKGAIIERRLAIPGIIAIALTLLISLFIRNHWAVLFLFPTLLLPPVFAGDLYLWMRHFGLNLNPKAPLSNAVKPFIPPILGEGKIAQFHALASFEIGFYLTLIAAALVFIAMICILKPSKSLSCSSLKADWKTKIPKAATIALFIFSSNFLSLSSHASNSLQAEIDKAQPYETLILKKGIYAGPIEIKKPLHLVGEKGAILDGGGRGTIVKILAPEVSVSGFVIRNSGTSLTVEDTGILVKSPKAIIENNRFENVLFGIYLRRASDSVIKNNILFSKDLPLARRGDLIRAWYSDRLMIEKNQTIGGRDVVLWYSQDTILKRNHFTRGRYALHFMYCNGAIVSNNIFDENTVGAYLMYSTDLRVKKNRIVKNRGVSGYGIGLKDMENAVIEENLVADNGIGAFLDQASGTYYSNLFAFNRVGIEMLPSAEKNVFMNNSFIENTEQVMVAGQGLNQEKNQWVKNFWSDYRGYDANHDGIGDFPYRSQKIFERLADRDPVLKFFYSSPMIQTLEFASSIFPIFTPQPKLTDEKPLMNPVIPPFAKNETPFSWSAAALSGSFLLPILMTFLSVSQKLKNEYEPASKDSAIAINIASLSKRYGAVQVLTDINLDIQKGETLVLWGANGAGKTTILHCLLGLVEFEGEARIFDISVAEQGKKVRELIGYVPQEIRFHQELTVWETIYFYARIRNISSEMAKKLIQDWDLTGFEKRKIFALSGGMKQKIALVVALLADPPILLLDEPTSNLDLRSRHELLCMLERLKKSGKTILLSSHHLSEVWKLADRVLVLAHGQKIKEGKPEEVRGDLGESVLLFLTVPAEHCQTAALKMRAHGLMLEPNGKQLLVEVAIDRKAEPFRILAEASIPILDFDFENAWDKKEIK